MSLVRIDANIITEEQSFHTAFARAFGFPDFYGRNMNAWIDCMGYLDDPAAGMSSVHVTSGHTLTLVIDDAQAFKQRCPALFDALIECAAYVNWRCAEQGREPLLALAMDL